MSIKYYKPFFLILFVSLVLLACKREYIVGGEIHDVNRYKNLTTYEALRIFSDFDTLVKVIDAAGIK
ncbi:MAG: hypothetical protein ACK5NK_08425, partial [Niabella sp.]